MFRKLVLTLPAFAPLAIAQIQSQVAPLPLPNGDVLLVGTTRSTTALGLYPASQHQQISLSSRGPVPFRDEPADILMPLGGSGNDIPQAAAVDPSGNIWIAGNTDSDDFNLVNPIVSQKVPYRTAGFVLELDPTGTKLLFATYLAGHQPAGYVPSALFATNATAIAIDAAGNLYVGGATDETDFPTTPGAFMTKGGTGADIFNETFYYSFVVKISPAGKFVYSTLLGTGGPDCIGGSACIGKQSTGKDVEGLAVNSAGAVTVSGLESGALSDYIARISPDGSKLLWSTNIGSGFTNLLMAQDLSCNVYLFGRYVTTTPPSYPGLPPQASTPGLFAAKLSSDGSTMLYSTDLGQSTDANVAGIVLDASGNAYLAGTSSSDQFPTLAGVPNLGADFVLRLDAAGSKPVTLFRFPRGIVQAPPAIDAKGRLLLDAPSGLLTLPLDYAFNTPFVVGFANAASYALSNALYPGEIVSIFGFDLAASPQNPQVFVGGTPATVLYAGPNQINIQVPFEFAQYSNPPQMEVVLPTGDISVSPVGFAQSLGIFTTDGVHAAALNQNGSLNSAANPAARGSIITLYGTGAIWHMGIQDGTIATAAAPLDQGQNRFQIVEPDGTPLSIAYAGAAPGIIYGVFQMNVQMTQNTFGPLTLQTIGLKFGDTAVSSNAVQIYLK